MYVSVESTTQRTGD